MSIKVTGSGGSVKFTGIGTGVLKAFNAVVSELIVPNGSMTVDSTTYTWNSFNKNTGTPSGWTRAGSWGASALGVDAPGIFVPSSGPGSLAQPLECSTIVSVQSTSSVGMLGTSIDVGLYYNYQEFGAGIPGYLASEFYAPVDVIEWVESQQGDAVISGSVINTGADQFNIVTSNGFPFTFVYTGPDSEYKELAVFTVAIVVV